MKNLLIILILFIVSSCSNIPIEVDDPYKATTLEIQESAKADTVLYKVVRLNDTLYILDSNTYMVERDYKL